MDITGFKTLTAFNRIYADASQRVCNNSRVYFHVYICSFSHAVYSYIYLINFIMRFHS